MSDRHEAFLAAVFEGRVTKASGATTDKGDGRQIKHEQTYCFAWDGKSTRGRSISVKVADWEKVRDQTVGYRPMLPLRLYHDDRLVETTDLVVLDVHDAAELIEMANKAVGLQEKLASVQRMCATSDDGHLWSEVTKGECLRCTMVLG